MFCHLRNWDLAALEMVGTEPIEVSELKRKHVIPKVSYTHRACPILNNCHMIGRSKGEQQQH
eukprot:4086077-Pyramimonas_sp.AAC.1